MFDVGFLEVLLIGVIALLVFGPERLPAVARDAGLWVGRARQMFNQFKTEMERTANVQEIQEITKQAELKETFEILEETKQELNQSIGETPSSSTPLSSTTTPVKNP